MFYFYLTIVGSFQKAIMQSGCIFNSWACHRKHKEVALKFAKKIGCQEEDPEQIVQYLRNVPAIDLVKCTIPPKANAEVRRISIKFFCKYLLNFTKYKYAIKQNGLLYFKDEYRRHGRKEVNFVVCSATSVDGVFFFFVCLSLIQSYLVAKKYDQFFL